MKKTSLCSSLLLISCANEIDMDPKEYIPTEHAPRNRKDYSINRTLEQVGVDEDALREVLHDYIQWCAEPRMDITET